MKLLETYNNLENSHTYKVYHGTNNEFDRFDFNRATQGIVWFTDSIDSIKNQEHGGAGYKHIMTRYITIHKPVGWDEYEKYGLGQLRQMGYDGVILPQGDKTDFFVFSNKSIRKVEPKEKPQLNEYYNDLGVVRLYHRISNKQMNDDGDYTNLWINLIKSVFNKGLVPYGNEIGEVIWFSDKFDDYSKNGQFVVALDFDTAANGVADNKYEINYEGHNAYAHAQIPFEDLIVVKIPVVIIHGRTHSNKSLIEYINTGLDSDGFNKIGGEVILFQDLFNEYVQPYINIPDYISKLDVNKIKLINVLSNQPIHEDLIRSTNSNRPHIDVNKVFEPEKHGIKPHGLWYEINGDWVKWCGSNALEWVKEYDIILVLDTYEKTVQFCQTYIDKNNELRMLQYIDWGKVAKDYKGIEIPNISAVNKGELRMSPWIWSWDVNSGCIWDLSTIRNYHTVDCQKPDETNKETHDPNILKEGELIRVGTDHYKNNYYVMSVRDDEFIHFTLKSHLVEIIRTKKLDIDKGVYIASIFAVSTTYGIYLPNVQHYAGGEAKKDTDNIVAIKFRTNTPPIKGQIEEVVWHQSINLTGFKIIPVDEAERILANTPRRLKNDRDRVFYKESLDTEFFPEDYPGETPRKFLTDLLAKSKRKVNEGVGDRYVDSKYTTPPDFSEFEDLYKMHKNEGEDMVYNNGKGSILIRNPKSLKNIGPDVRGIVDKNGNLYIEQSPFTIHDGIISRLGKLHLIKPVLTWQMELPTEYISVQRVGEKNQFAIGQANMVMVRQQHRYASSSKLPSVEQAKPIFQAFLNKAKQKNPTLNFMNENITYVKERGFWELPHEK